MTLGEELQEKLAIEPIWNIPLGNIDIPITKGVVATWGVMAFLVIVSIIFTRNMKIIPGKKQAAVELAIGKLYGVFYNILGERGKRYIPYLLTVLLYLGVSNMLGLIGVAPPTKELNTTAGLAIMSIVLIQYAAIHQRGVKGAETFRSSDGHYAADEHFRAVHQTAVTMYATFRQHSGRIHYHGTDHILHSGSRAAGIQFLFRYLRRTAAGICILFPDISVHSGSG